MGRQCNRCEGDCQDDADCVNGLVCFKRGKHGPVPWRTPVPGCSGNPKQLYGKNFCILGDDDAPPTAVVEPLPESVEPSLSFSGQCATYTDRKCGLCEGDCERDSDCAPGLGCFIRNSGTFSASIPVPGCSVNPPDLFAKDFCVDLALYPCKDQEGTFVTIYGFLQTCDWIKSNKNRETRRCELYGHFCRETCGYCRTRD